MFAFRHTDTSVEVEAESAPSLVPAVGTNVLARVVRLAPDRAECTGTRVRVVGELFSRQKDLRNFTLYRMIYIRNSI